MAPEDTLNEELCAKLLRYYNVARSARADDIQHLKIHRSGYNAHAHVIDFHYDDERYLASDDYTLEDNLVRIRTVFERFTTIDGGSPVRNPHPQSDGAKYAGGIDGIEFHLWHVN